MRWRPYPRYRDSGVEWLGEVPEWWEVYRVKQLCSMRAGVSIASEIIDTEGAYPVYGGNGIRGYAERFSHSGSHVLVGRQGALCGNTHNAQGKFWASEHAVVASPSVGTDSQWLGYLLASMKLGTYSQAAAQPGLAVERILNIVAPRPTPEEQRAIADFLDRQTARLDTLIAKKRQLIERLREKRAALISHTVTRGLPPDEAARAGLPVNPPLKDSGVEWIGEVPEHWEVQGFRYLVASLEQGWSPVACSSPASEDEWGVLKLSAVKHGRFLPSENKVLDLEPMKGQVLTPAEGDVLLTRANTPAYVGDVCRVPQRAPYRLIPDLIYRARLRDPGTCSRFVAWYLLSRAARAPIEAEARGSSGSMVKLSQSHIRSWPIPTPPVDEQQAIADYLDRETATIDRLIDTINRAIDRLQEYRSAVITAAVTGTIDVRDAAATEYPHDTELARAAEPWASEAAGRL